MNNSKKTTVLKTYPSKIKLGNKIWLAGCLALSTLSGCTGLEIPLIAAGFTTGSLAAADRRTLGTQVEDRGIQLKAESRLFAKFDNDSHINATVYNRRLLLTGEVPDEDTRKSAEKEAAHIENVRVIVNELEIAGKSSLSSRSNDAIISSKVKAAMIDNRNIYSGAYKYVTERGNVYLLGLATEQEANEAAETIAQVSGVNKIIKSVDYISESERQRIIKNLNAGSNQPTPSARTQ
jgi:osmotically-inducible protein OsmY